MALSAGDRLGPYEVLAPLGEGGMGVVFRARDTRLNRDVALKVLPDSFAADPDRLARFQREAQVLAALNHPNIAAIYGIEDRALVMELVEGVDLTEAIRAGRFAGGDGLSEAKSVATQIASALEAAHDAGVVHRDLKPANIRLRPDGTVKVLDFGLARTMDSGPGTLDPANSPTMTTPAMTQAGMIMGTAAYMSPEQARGRAVDRRADIWAFGCVLYEMLTRTTVFARDSVTDTLAAITRDEPDWKPRLDLPPDLVRLLKRCLDKDPRTRLRDIGEARIVLSGDGVTTDDARGLPASHVSHATRSTGRLAWIAVTVLVTIAASAGTWWWTSRGQQTGAPPMLAAISRVTTDSGLTKDPAIAPGGSLLAYASDRGGSSLNIWVQPLPDGQPVQITHDDVDASEPSFSSDGSRIVYRSERNGGGIYVVPALGGTPRFVAAKGRSPRFSPDGKAVAYGSGGRGASSELWVIDLDGGAPRRVATDLSNVGSHVWSPDGRFMAAIGARGTGVDATADWWLIDPSGGPSTGMGIFERFRSAGIEGGPAAWVPGHIVFPAFTGETSSLWALEVSADGHAGSAQPRRITAGVGADVSPAVVTGADGLTIYYANLDTRANIYRVPVIGAPLDTSLERLTDAAALDNWPSVSADGRSMVFGSTRLTRPSVWLRDLTSGRETPLTAAGGGMMPTIGADGQRLAFVVPQEPSFTVAIRAVDGGATDLQPEVRFGWSWPNATVFLGSKQAGGVQELLVLNPVTGKVRPALSEMKQGFYGHGQLSPDGRWASAMEWSRADHARIIVFPFGDSPAAPADVVPLTGEQTVEEEHAWSSKGDAIYFVSERDGTRCFWMRRLDPATKRPVGEITPVLHLHGARRSMISTAESPQRFVLHDGKLYFSMQEVRASIWKATLKTQ